MRVFVDLETEVKSRFLNHEGPRVWFLTDLENGMTFTVHYKYREPVNPICRHLRCKQEVSNQILETSWEVS